MGFFQTPLFRRKRPSDLAKAMSMGRGDSSSRPSIQVGEFLALAVIVGCLGFTAYCMYRARVVTLTEQELNVYKQYVWFAVSIAAPMALGGGMGRLGYTGGGYSMGTTQPAITPSVVPTLPGSSTVPAMPTVNTGQVMDPWASMQSIAVATMPIEKALEGAMSLPGDLDGGQDDSGSPIDVHGPQGGGS